MEPEEEHGSEAQMEESALAPVYDRADSRIFAREEDKNSIRDIPFSWTSLVTVVMVASTAIALSAYFIYDVTSETFTADKKRASTKAHSDISTDEPPIRVVPNVLLCGTAGGDVAGLATMLTRYCTHTIYTGAVHVVFDATKSSPSVNITDDVGFKPIVAMSKSAKRYVSFVYGAAAWELRPVVSAVTEFLHKHRLHGIELRLTAHEHVEKCVNICATLKEALKREDGLLIRVSHTVKLARESLQRLSEIAKFLILETQAARRDDLHTRRYPNPYQPYNASHVNDVYMRHRLWRIHPWKRQLGTESVCFTLSLAVIRGVKGTVNGKNHRIISYSYTRLKEPCVQRDLKALIDPKALSRSKQDEDTFFGYDNRRTLTTKLRSLAHEFPQYCMAAYNVEMDDFEGLCPHNSTPLLRVLRKLVTPIIHMSLQR
ncbi:uncharacterized protein LOC135392089 isoform X3 [Ornithodoros turicata]|uniref:uncharacterized protein LOC135392089 isoform X3 n=1 Tax=Ornithodoros turicata TaxID=34597 RepID=UPI0031387161